mgnify:CR=1 FL=1
MKLIGFLTGKLIIFLFCLFVIQGCVTTNGILQNATNLESKGMYCEAVWNELTRLEDDPSLKRDELILRIGNKCILSSINEAKQILNNSVTSNDFENVLNKINLAKQKVSDINFKFHSNIVKWEPAYQQLENQIILKLKEELYQDAFVLFSQKDFENAEMVKFSKNGSDATNGALKIARAYTGRDMVGICAEHPFFSVDDWFICTTPMNSGIPGIMQNLVTTFSYNNLESIEKMFAENPGKIASVSYTHLRAHETVLDLVCRLLLEKKTTPTHNSISS